MSNLALLPTPPIATSSVQVFRGSTEQCEQARKRRTNEHLSSDSDLPDFFFTKPDEALGQKASAVRQRLSRVFARMSESQQHHRATVPRALFPWTSPEPVIAVKPPIHVDLDWGVRYPLASEPWSFEKESEWFSDASPQNREQAVALWKLGMRTAAKRVAACARYARRLKCPDCSDEYKETWRCKVRTHPPCAKANHDRLHAKYSQLFSLIPSERYARPGWDWKILDFAFYSDGCMPESKDLREAARVIKWVVKRALRITASEKKQPWILKQWTLVRCTEFGFDNTNLHFHGAYFGPWLSQRLLSRLFAQATAGKSFRVWIDEAEGKTPEKAFQSALAHALKYTAKPAASTPEGLALLEKALRGTRVVEVLGEFYGVKLLERSGSPSCPKCRVSLHAMSAWLPISKLSHLPELTEANFGFEKGCPSAKPRDPPDRGVAADN